MTKIETVTVLISAAANWDVRKPQETEPHMPSPRCVCSITLQWAVFTGFQRAAFSGANVHGEGAGCPQGLYIYKAGLTPAFKSLDFCSHFPLNVKGTTFFIESRSGNWTPGFCSSSNQTSFKNHKGGWERSSGLRLNEATTLGPVRPGTFVACHNLSSDK